MTTIAEWRDKAILCAATIQAEGYYLAEWNAVKPANGFADLQTKEEILKPFQDFWEALPDSLAIRTHPFFDICDLAEEYCFGEDGE